MINRRILIFGLIAILGITAIKLGTDLVKKGLLEIEKSELEVVRSDEDDIDILEDEDMRKTVLYFKSKSGFLVPVMKKIPWDEGIAKASLANMVDTSELRESLLQMGLSPIIPAGTKVNGISINEETGLCKVDFSEEILDTDSIEDEEDMIKGIVYTLTEFPKIEEVQLMVNGKILDKSKNGLALSKPMGRENINIVGDLKDARTKQLVYFREESEDNFDYYIPVTVPTMAQTPNIYTALDILFEGPPKETSLKSDLPKNISLGGIEIKEGTVFVDISSEDKVDMSQAEINLLVKNIALTLSEFKEVDNVELIVDGKVVNSAIPVFANEY